MTERRWEREIMREKKNCSEMKNKDEKREAEN